MICPNCGCRMSYVEQNGGWNCSECPVFVVPQRQSPADEVVPEQFTGVPVYERVRKLEDRVAKLESWMADEKRRRNPRAD